MDIAAFTTKILDNFDRIRGKNVEENFWDLVVVTASDKDQADAYKEQIELKKNLNHLPLGVDYIVFYDPPGPKIGCGGSTMYVIHRLHSAYGEELWTKKVLLLNAGGQSQRLPSASVLGKIFTALPIGDPMYQLFDFKLACYLPLLESMKPGIFHAAADTIEVYDLGTNKNQWCFNRPGFTALAHPSSLDIGRTHGVYVLEEETQDQQPTSMRKCLEVLQKPSIEKMRSKEAVLTKKSGGEFVYTDSCFHFDHVVSRKLLQFYKDHPIKCEIDSYGDFLQCLGPRATVDYTNDVKNVRTIDSTLVETRSKLFHVLKGTPLNVLALEASKFYHFGTLSEYVENFCNDPVIAHELGFKKHTFSDLPKYLCMEGKDDSPWNGPDEKKLKLSKSAEECIMSSALRGPGSRASPGCVIEYCDFQQSVSIGSSCIISNCQLLTDGPQKEVISIPPGTFMHTVWMNQGDRASKGAATFILGIHDNIKKSVAFDNVTDLKWFGKPLTSVMKSLQFDLEKVFECKNQCSLWTAKIFPVCENMSESFQMSYKLLQCISRGGQMSRSPLKYMVSMEDVVKRKSVTKMLDYRKELYEAITSKKQSKQKVSNL